MLVHTVRTVASPTLNLRGRVEQYAKYDERLPVYLGSSGSTLELSVCYRNSLRPIGCTFCRRHTRPLREGGLSRPMDQLPERSLKSDQLALTERRHGRFSTLLSCSDPCRCSELFRQLCCPSQNVRRSLWNPSGVSKPFCIGLLRNVGLQSAKCQLVVTAECAPTGRAPLHIRSVRCIRDL